VAPFAEGDIKLVDLPSHSAGALYDLNFFMVERPDGWRASCEYDAARFNPATVDVMLADWRHALSGQAPVTTAPADTVMTRLVAIWQETLGVSDVSPDDSFFDLGGHSLLAARMLARVESVFGQRIGMAALFTDSTLGALAARLAAPAATGAPLIAVGDGAEWQGFGEVLGTGRRFICVADAKAVANYHLDGPITVLGAGKNGQAAFRFAQALEAQGRTVTLVLVDAAPPSSARKLWPLRQQRPAEQFGGRVLLFRRPSTAAAAVAGWSSHLVGDLESGVLPAGPWHAHVAARIEAARR
jgi:acyl carrier protein